MTPLEQAQAEFSRAYEVLAAFTQAAQLDAKRTCVGKYYKHVQQLRDDYAVTWPVYIAATSLDEAHLHGWHFQAVPTGQIEIAPETDLQHAFLTDQCTEVERGEFITAFNALLTDIAHYATRLPPA